MRTQAKRKEEKPCDVEHGYIQVLRGGINRHIYNREQSARTGLGVSTTTASSTVWVGSPNYDVCTDRQCRHAQAERKKSRAMSIMEYGSYGGGINSHILNGNDGLVSTLWLPMSTGSTDTPVVDTPGSPNDYDVYRQCRVLQTGPGVSTTMVQSTTDGYVAKFLLLWLLQLYVCFNRTCGVTQVAKSLSQLCGVCVCVCVCRLSEISIEIVCVIFTYYYCMP